MMCQVESPKLPIHTDHYSCCYRVPCALGLHVQTLSVGHKPGWGVTSNEDLLLERKTFQYRMNSNSLCQTWEDIPCWVN